MSFWHKNREKLIFAGDFKRGESPSFYFFPLSFKGEGEAGGEVTILNSGSLKNHRFFRVKSG
jgi:hypothetical protein